MLVYRSTQRQIDFASTLDDLETRIAGLRAPCKSRHDEVRNLLIDIGQLESAVVDGECEAEEVVTPIIAKLNEFSSIIASLFIRSWRGESLPVAPLDRCRSLLSEIRRLARSGHVVVSMAEGFAYYGLFPETYIAATEDLIRQLVPEQLLLFGIRSIGTTLSAVVSATLALAGIPTTRITVRPRGHPFDRELRIGTSVARAVRELARDPRTIVAIVDEGPGISGSSFAAVAEWLAEIGVPDERITFLPSWNPAAESLRNGRARSQWNRHRKFIGDFDRQWIASGRLGRIIGARVVADLSAGAWRERVYASAADYPAVQPQHERRKLLGIRADGERILIKFEGLGSYAAAHGRRAGRLAAAGFGPPITQMAQGFLVTRWVTGSPMRSADVNADFLRHVGRYVAWMRCTEQVGSSCDVGPLLEMLELNVSEGLGLEWSEAVRHIEEAARWIEGVPAVRVDGRMQPHEWIRAGSGFVKTDGVSHHDDHFYPGVIDAAWDIAGACVELELNSDAERMLLREYEVTSGDHGVEERLRFLKPAYLAFRLGYTTLAAEMLGESADAERMRRGAARYGALLRTELTSASTRATSGADCGQSYASGT